MQNDKNKNENKMTRAELLAEIERQKAIIAAKERGEGEENNEDKKDVSDLVENVEAEKTDNEAYWSGLPFPTPGDPPNPGIEPMSPASCCNDRQILYH